MTIATYQHGLLLPVVLLCLGAMPALAADDAPPSVGDGPLFARLDTSGDGRLTSEEIPATHRRLFERLVRKADADRDGALSEAEFIAGLVPSQSEKPIVQLRAESIANAGALRYVLLRLDVNGDCQIDAQEVPEELRPVFRQMVADADQNNNGSLELDELSRRSVHLSPIAGRFVHQQGIDVESELAKLQETLGDQAKRFDEEPLPPHLLNNPNRAGELFARLDHDGNGKVEQAEVPTALEPRFVQLVIVADVDGDQQLTKREFVVGSRRIADIIRRSGRDAGESREAPGGPAMEMAPPER